MQSTRRTHTHSHADAHALVRMMGAPCSAANGPRLKENFAHAQSCRGTHAGDKNKKSRSGVPAQPCIYPCQMISTPAHARLRACLPKDEHTRSRAPALPVHFCLGKDKHTHPLTRARSAAYPCLPNDVHTRSQAPAQPCIHAWHIEKHTHSRALASLVYLRLANDKHTCSCAPTSCVSLPAKCCWAVGPLGCWAVGLLGCWVVELFFLAVGLLSC